MTNGDEFRQLNNEELANVLLNMCSITCCLLSELGGGREECQHNCKVCVAAWLGEEVQEDG